MTVQTLNFIFQRLIIPYCLPISCTFVLLASKVFHCLVIKHTIGLNTTHDLCEAFIIHSCQKGLTNTYGITVVRFASQASTPLCQYEAERRYSQISSLHNMNKFEYLLYATMTRNMTMVSVHRKMIPNATKATVRSINVGMIQKRINYRAKKKVR